ncbi:hypothetical protein [Clostridium estertheticum]|uniref:hypothetical protein n=1 Tax=Clostridium estertheticum TaxID=238834 RepID=UPI001CF26B1B|nr:hypothetical protein [Clostridium estertheticum]MCB2343294.1 hypothetical protein [Clostridium estertheticum]
MQVRIISLIIHIMQLAIVVPIRLRMGSPKNEYLIDECSEYIILGYGELVKKCGATRSR